MEVSEQQRLKTILANTRNIAVVGASNRPERASYQVMEYLKQQGYRVFPVNPQLAGAMILGETCVAGLEDLDHPVQLVNVFRRGGICCRHRQRSYRASGTVPVAAGRH
ncbi:CoA-binding protein [Oceanimonas baumannii]|uniref:CoA-binding domain-containing protein n=1 Tax=Oceanimonas baumannii TaxID=129578 RepID=A0ABY2EXN9_9GAMM|nr:CoA-binding protein [Oceanimonas baumannii]TDW58561.1 hypothetical protein LY04_02339 [Oceanimonas baumannii]